MVELKVAINIVRSSLPMLIVILVTLAFAVLLFFLHRKNNKWLLWLGIPTLITGILSIVGSITAKSFAIISLEDNAKELVSIIEPFVNLLFNCFDRYGIILSAVGIIMIGFYIIFKKRDKKEEE